MKYELNESQIDTILRGLDALEEAAESENRCTDDADIHESNDTKIAEAKAMYEYLARYNERQKRFFKFSDRRRLAELFDIWAEKNSVAKSPEGVIAFLYMVCLLDIEGAMEYIKRNNGKAIIRSGDNVFELVDSVLPGYIVWNIGKNMVDGYLPLCRLKPVQPFPGGREIEVDTLKAIKCDGAQVILSAIGYGPETPLQMERFIKKHEGQKKHAVAVRRMKAALPYMRQLRWDGDR